MCLDLGSGDLPYHRYQLFSPSPRAGSNFVFLVDIGDENRRVTDFLTQLIEEPFIRNESEIVFFVESNNGAIARAAEIYKHIRAWATRYSVKLRAIAEDPTAQNRPGFWLTHRRKEEMAMMTSILLNKEKLLFHDPIVSTIKPSAKQKLLTQMSNYRKHFKPIKRDGWANEETLPYSFSGKNGHEVDDLCVIMQECVRQLPLVMSGQQQMYRFAVRAPLPSSRSVFQGARLHYYESGELGVPMQDDRKSDEDDEDGDDSVQVTRGDLPRSPPQVPSSSSSSGGGGGSGGDNSVSNPTGPAPNKRQRVNDGSARMGQPAAVPVNQRVDVRGYHMGQQLGKRKNTLI